MIADKEIDQLCEEFKEWRKNRKRPQTYVSNVTCPSAQYTITISSNAITKDFIDNQPYNRLQTIIERMEDTAKGLMDAGVIGFGLSLKSEIDDLKKVIMGEWNEQD